MLKFLSAVVVGLSLVATAHAAGEVDFQAGKNYFLIEPAQPTSTGDKVEVTEVFSYACSHCNDVQPMVSKLKNALPDTAEFVYMPAQFGFDAWKTFARAYYTAQALGVAEKAHAELFSAIYVDKRVNSQSPKLSDLAKFYSTYGVSVADFEATAKSFSIETKLKRNDSLAKAYGVEGTPTFVVNGKYRFNAQSAGGYDQIEPLVHYLIERELAAK